jgi:hypothetical protein
VKIPGELVVCESAAWHFLSVTPPMSIPQSLCILDEARSPIKVTKHSLSKCLDVQTIPASIVHITKPLDQM